MSRRGIVRCFGGNVLDAGNFVFNSIPEMNIKIAIFL